REEASSTRRALRRTTAPPSRADARDDGRRANAHAGRARGIRPWTFDPAISRSQEGLAGFAADFLRLLARSGPRNDALGAPERGTVGVREHGAKPQIGPHANGIGAEGYRAVASHRLHHASLAGNRNLAFGVGQRCQNFRGPAVAGAALD